MSRPISLYRLALVRYPYLSLRARLRSCYRMALTDVRNWLLGG
jgi:hypothetical protein